MQDCKGNALKPGDAVVLAGKVDSILPDGSMYVRLDNSPDLLVNVWTKSAELVVESDKDEKGPKGKGGKSPAGD